MYLPVLPLPACSPEGRTGHHTHFGSTFATDIASNRSCRQSTNHPQVESLLPAALFRKGCTNQVDTTCRVVPRPLLIPRNRPRSSCRTQSGIPILVLCRDKSLRFGKQTRFGANDVFTGSSKGRILEGARGLRVLGVFHVQGRIFVIVLCPLLHTYR